MEMLKQNFILLWIEQLYLLRVIFTNSLRAFLIWFLGPLPNDAEIHLKKKLGSWKHPLCKSQKMCPDECFVSYESHSVGPSLSLDLDLKYKPEEYTSVYSVICFRHVQHCDVRLCSGLLPTLCCLPLHQGVYCVSLCYNEHSCTQITSYLRTCPSWLITVPPTK